MSRKLFFFVKTLIGIHRLKELPDDKVSDKVAEQQPDAQRHVFYHRNKRYYMHLARLTPNEVTDILRANEFTKEFEGSGSVRSYDSNQLASNNPLEDTRAEAKCLLTNGFLVGVIDGHGGGACAQVLSKRLLPYISACLLPPEILRKYLDSLLLATDDINNNSKNNNNNDIENSSQMRLLESYNDRTKLLDELELVYRRSFVGFLKDLAEEDDASGRRRSSEGDERRDRREGMEEALERAFLRLDGDISEEALSAEGENFGRMLSVAASGAVAAVAHIDGPHLHVANVGDCQVVVGVLQEGDQWTAKMMTEEHNSDNRAEVERIYSEHPESERKTVITNERLLGHLAPFRSMGDYRYKWSYQIMKEKIAPYYGENAIPANYHTPPYLTGKPEVKYHRLTPNDKFIIIASDGLWDLISPLEAVRLVGEHMSGKMTLSPLRLPRKNMRLSEINDMLLHRKEGLKNKPLDANAATHLIRNALGGTEYGIDHTKISKMLTLPGEVVRLFRDDITITVVYLDSEFLRHCPP